MYYWIKERHNPQFDKPYFVAVGRMSVKEAKKKENTVYGCNYMHKFTNKKTYEKRLEELNKEGLLLR